MKFLIVGLGNPGKEYEETRHNIGFKVVDEISSNYKCTRDHTIYVWKVCKEKERQECQKGNRRRH